MGYNKAGNKIDLFIYFICIKIVQSSRELVRPKQTSTSKAIITAAPRNSIYIWKWGKTMKSRGEALV
jgi:hypothetical protein